METIAEIRANIAKLPQEAATKPILAGLAEHLESFSNNTVLATMQQEIDALKAGKATEQPHGLCGEETCGPCVAQAETIVALGREQVQSDIDQALGWFGGPVLQEKVAAVVGKWISEGRPQPQAEPYLTISLE